MKIQILLAFSLAAVVSWSAPRMDRSRFQIGVFGYSDKLSDENRVREMKECGIDYVYGVPVKARNVLDNLSKYGMGCVVDGVIPKPWGGGTRKAELLQGDFKGSFTSALDDYLMRMDHPAVWMFSFSDEPNAMDFPDMGHIVSLTHEKCPDIPVYVNLFPNYALAAENSVSEVVSQLGTSNYIAHVESYDRCLALDYLSFDHYIYNDNREKSISNVARLQENFRIVADVCRRSGRSLWFVPQVNTQPKNKIKMSLNKLRFQAYLAMAYGAESLTWACWYPRWWDCNVYDRNDVRDDEVYGRLKAVNGEIRALSSKYMAYRNVRTECIGGHGAAAEYNDGLFKRVRAVDGAPLVVGGMVGRKGTGQALLIFAAADPWGESSRERTVSFECPKPIFARGVGGSMPVVRRQDGTCAITVVDSQCVFVATK